VHDLLLAVLAIHSQHSKRSAARSVALHRSCGACVLQEAAVIVLDVGPHMANHLPALRKSVFLLAESKVR
jgi:hypothetical protein